MPTSPNSCSDKGYVVHGIKRRTSLFNTDRIDHLYEDPSVRDRHLILHYGDLTDASSLVHVMQQVQPDEVYNLGAQSHVAVSFEEPEYTANSDAIGTLRLLEAIRILGLSGTTRFYQASTSEMFGLVGESPQRETTTFHPRSPYGVAKLYAHWITVNYREAYGLFACNGILFNHESPIRGETFVTRKITRALARIALGLQDCLYLGNLDARRDWGHARDYVRAMWLMLQQSAPEDFVIATGEQHSVRDFAAAAAAELGVALAWEGSGPDEVGRVAGVDSGPRHEARAGPGRRAHRSSLLPARRSRHAAGRRDQGPDEARLDARSALSRAGRGNGARGLPDRATRRARPAARTRRPQARRCVMPGRSALRDVISELDELADDERAGTLVAPPAAGHPPVGRRGDQRVMQTRSPRRRGARSRRDGACAAGR